MTKSLPPAPNMEHLKKQAKGLRKLHTNRNPECCEILTHLYHFAGLSGDAILDSKITLSDAQYALAMHYGFKSWRDLRAHVASLTSELSTFKRDFSKLQLKGDGNKQDPLSLSIQAACQFMGRDVDYNTVYALSTNCFSPSLDTGEPSKCWWGSTYGRDTAFDLIADGLGLTIRPLEPKEAEAPNIPPKLTSQEEQDNWWRTYERLRRIPLIRQAQKQGEVVLVWREWVVYGGPHGFVPWAWWGLVTETRDDGTVLGATLNGHHDNPLDWIGGLYSIGLEAEPNLTAIDARLLQRILHRLRSETPPYRTDDQRIVFGLQAMDAWIEQMQQTPYCPSCAEEPEKMWTCAVDTAMPVYEGTKTAAKYLQEMANRLEGSSRQQINKASECYSHIAVLLKPSIQSGSEEHYNTLIGKPAKQKAHADTVLRPIKELMAQAATCIEQALSSL